MGPLNARAGLRLGLAVLALWGALAPAGAGTAAEAAAQRRQIRAAWHVPEPLPELRVEMHGAFEVEPGVIAEKVSYATQFGLRVPAIVYRPRESTGRASALVVVNGHGGDKFSWYAGYTGVLYARAGALVLTYDPAGEGERNGARNSGTRAHDRVDPALPLGARLGGLMMTDVLQAVSYLAARADVDPRRIAAVGYSMGSFILSVTGAVETRLRAVVLAGGGNLDGPEGYWDRSKPQCQGEPYRALAFLGDRPVALYALQADRGATLLCNGREDTTVSIPAVGEAHLADVQRRLQARLPAGARAFELEWVDGVGHRPFFVTRTVARWLERELDLPRWTAAEIEAMPETHVAAWARERGVAMDPRYVAEHREGGTRALGRDVPAPARAQLMVFSEAEFARRRDEVVHDAWLRAVRAQLGAAETRRGADGRMK